MCIDAGGCCASHTMPLSGLVSSTLVDCAFALQTGLGPECSVHTSNVYHAHGACLHAIPLTWGECCRCCVLMSSLIATCARRSSSTALTVPAAAEATAGRQPDSYQQNDSSHGTARSSAGRFWVAQLLLRRDFFASFVSGYINNDCNTTRPPKTITTWQMKLKPDGDLPDSPAQKRRACR